VTACQADGLTFCSMLLFLHASLFGALKAGAGGCDWLCVRDYAPYVPPMAWTMCLCAALWLLLWPGICGASMVWTRGGGIRQHLTVCPYPYL
jgi:hypothetical protein